MDNLATLPPVSYKWNLESISFHMVWFLLVAATWSCYLNLDWFFTKSSPPIATLLEQVGNVQFRPMDLALWKETQMGQGFHEGEILATAENSKAVISLQGGKTLQLDDNSQVKITLQQSATEQLLLVTLLKGSATTKTVAPSATSAPVDKKALPQKVQIISGKQAIDVENDADFRVEKNIDEVTPIIEVMKGKVSVTTPTTGLRQELREAAIHPPRVQSVAHVELPKVLALSHAPSIAVVIESFAPMPKLTWPTDGTHLWTHEPLSSEGASLSFLFQSMGKKQDIQKWSPSIQADPEHRWTPEDNAAGSTVDIPWAQLLAVGKPTSAADVGGHEVIVSAGGALKRRYLNTEPENQKYETPIHLTFSSASELAAKPVLIRLSALTSGSTSAAWAEEARGASLSLPYALFLQNGADLASVFNLLSKPVSFTVHSQPSIPTEDGFVFIRNEEPVASLQGNVDNMDKLKKIRKSLKASMVYKGKPQDFITLAEPKENTSMQEILLESLRTHPNLFILIEGKLVKIDSQLLRKNRSALSFIKGISRIAFIREVDVIDMEK